MRAKLAQPSFDAMCGSLRCGSRGFWLERCAAAVEQRAVVVAVVCVVVSGVVVVGLVVLVFRVYFNFEK